MVQKDLAKTLRAIARDGSAYFYKGDYAKAVGDWFGKKGDAIDENGESIALKPFSVIVRIPYRTLANYTNKDPKKRHKLGKAS